ncbi:MAG: hypothetical protein LBJ64_09165, partial [Deltaproteobacteria bacterium]|nr:hypothetical protein [Deltaproteobacteria bacterium]
MRQFVVVIAIALAIFFFSPLRVEAQDDVDITRLFSGAFDADEPLNPSDLENQDGLGLSLPTSLPQLPPNIVATPPPPPPPSVNQVSGSLPARPESAPSSSPDAVQAASPYDLGFSSAPSGATPTVDEGLGDLFDEAEGQIFETPNAEPTAQALATDSNGASPMGLVETDLTVQPETSGSLLGAQGQVVAPPPPPWRRESRETVGVPRESGPLPEFDTSQGRWQQMEIGQFDRPRNSAPPSFGGQTSVENSLLGQNDGRSASGTGASAGVGGAGGAAGTVGSEPSAEPNDRAFIRNLFSDLVPAVPDIASAEPEL